MAETINGMALTFSPQAKQVVHNMQDRVHALRAWYGEDHTATVLAQRSLLSSLTTMIGLGGRVWAEGDPEDKNTLSLYGQNEFISYGVVFHGTHFPKEAMRRDDMPMPGAPQPGEWSVHS